MAGETVTVAIETSLVTDMGSIIWSGATRSLAGEPETLGGIGRNRFVYAPTAGRFHIKAHIGDSVVTGETLAHIGDFNILAPLDGIVRGFTWGGVDVAEACKVIEIDPRGEPSACFGLGERPRRIADGVSRALALYEEKASLCIRRGRE